MRSIFAFPLFFAALPASAQSTAFTCQGEMKNGAHLASGPSSYSVARAEENLRALRGTINTAGQFTIVTSNGAVSDADFDFVVMSAP